MDTYSLISNLPYVGKGYAKKLNALGIFTIFDLLYYFPFRYEDTSNIVEFSDLSRDIKRTTKATLLKITNIQTKFRKSIQKGVITDGLQELEVIWFNQPFLKKNIKIDEEYLFYGKLSENGKQLLSPQYQQSKTIPSNGDLGSILPIYPLTKGITNKWITKRASHILNNIDSFTNIEETLPKDILTKYQLLPVKQALNNIHFPGTQTDITSSRERFGFEELLNIQIHLLKEREKRLKSKGISINTTYAEEMKEIKKKLPYNLTSSQKESVLDIEEDYKKSYPMRRLIQGDVGSGKTIIAVLAMIPIIKAGHQVVFLAPTEVLAKQQYKYVNELLGDKYNIKLITGKTAKKTSATVRIDITIGTHAILFRKDTLISDLGLIIIDEQHRFGVSQRRELLDLKTSKVPHQLFLTATPIPRTLSQSLFGDLDVSKIETIANRKTVQTRIIPEGKRFDAYNWINTFVNKESQAFWICPLIEEGEDTELKSVEQYYHEIKQHLPNKRIQKLHGKMPADKKNEILHNFQLGKIDILISTTVVEVGIDIPNATVIVIEDAERFGLAQLHQLRGRVGRNDKNSWCFLYSNSFNKVEQVTKRLQYFANEKDGITIAKYDLQTRGPGEVYGTIQSGLPNLKIASFSNLDLIRKTREAAVDILGSQPKAGSPMAKNSKF